ncbi:putative amino acid transporter [Talaromyces proteolyticus]|uniref:Amino acid transporter n=1 Tax=Talaromyces proteolyticus TaxID=1131652 RepID=A0AAD4KUE9_9EURO|nr:putative amino acid transporter [Talaromyces proteolyticus]KAH8700209.1 putative amino acid transporter [Talaromyces proteolyticus]
MSEISKMKNGSDNLIQAPSMVDKVNHKSALSHDDVFGEISEKGPNYRNVGWIGTVALMMKTQIGLGVLSIPSAFDTLGLVPGIVCLCAIAAITTWSSYMVGVFKLHHREVYSIADAGGLMFGRLGHGFFGITLCLYWIFVAGSGMLGISISLNAVSTHGTCTAVFVAVAAIIGFICSSIRTLGRITSLAWIGLICILTAILTVTIAVGLQDRPVAAPQEGEWKSNYKIINNPSFTDAVTAISSLVFACAGAPAFFSIVSEMRNPTYYTRSLIICQSALIAIYITIGTVVYYYCGSYVTSPVLGSAGATVKKICYGFALPGLIVTTTLVIHMPAKYIFIRILRGSKHLNSDTFIHWGTWLSCTFSIAVIAYVIASAIPVFDGLVSLIGALLGTLMSFQPMGCMWLYDNWSRGKAEQRPAWVFMVCWCIFVVISGMFLMVSGTYGSVVGVIDTYRVSGGSAAWSCADNSNSV